MYCLKCQRGTETKNIATATSKNGRLMRRGQCVKCDKTKTQIHQKRCYRWKLSQYFGEQTPFQNAFARP